MYGIIGTILETSFLPEQGVLCRNKLFLCSAFSCVQVFFYTLVMPLAHCGASRTSLGDWLAQRSLKAIQRKRQTVNKTKALCDGVCVARHILSVMSSHDYTLIPYAMLVVSGTP